MSPSDDDPLVSRETRFHIQERELSRVTRIGDDSGKGFRKISEGQSSFDKDIQGAETQFATRESEGQLLEDIEKVGPMVTSVCFPLLGVPVSMSPSDDDPLACQNAVDQLRRERSLRPSHVAEGGGDASQSYQEDRFEFERPYFGPSHVVEGGGVGFKPFCSEHHEVKLPTESREDVLRQSIGDIERSAAHDSRLYKFLWAMKGHPSSSVRGKATQTFWQSLKGHRSGDFFYDDLPQPDNLSLARNSFILNDFFKAQDELYMLEHPMRPPPIRWSRRSSAVTGGPGSLSSSIRTGSGSTTGSTDTCAVCCRPSYTSGAFSSAEVL
jgi:hypothetical protein